MKSILPVFSLLLPAALLSGLPRTATAQSTTATALYVNDGSTTGDMFTSATGNDVTGDGSAAAPFATVSRALLQADLSTQTIFIDAGTYTERIALNKPVSLQGAGTATAQPTSATIFDGGLLPAPTQTNEAGLLITVSGGTSGRPLTIADLTFQNYDFGVQADGSNPQAHFLLEDLETVHNRRQGIFWRSLGGVEHLTFRRVRAAYTAEGTNSSANGAGRGLFLVNGHKADILIEGSTFEMNRRGGIDINDGSVSNLTVRNNQFSQNAGGALVVLGAAGSRSGGSFTSIAALIEGNAIRNNASNGMELKACTGNGQGRGAGSFVVRNNYIARTIGAPTSLTEDNAGMAFIDRDRNVIATGGGVNGDLITGGAYLEGNTIRGYLADANSSNFNINGFGMVLEGGQNKVFGNVVAQCQRAVQVQDRPANSTGYTPFFDSSRNGLVVSSGDSIRGNRLDSCATAIRTVNLTNPVDASLNWLGATTATAVRGTAGTGGLVTTLAGPAASFAEQSAFAATGRIDYSPFLGSNLDAGAATGFQPSLAQLTVDAYSPQSSTDAPLAEGLALVTENGTLGLSAAAYNESISLSKNLTLTAEATTTLRDLTLNGAGKVLTLGAPLTVTSALTLTNGLISTTASNLLTLTDQATATAGNATSYVEGPLRKEGQQAFVFPLGKGGQWARLGISAPASATTAFTAEYVATPYATRTANAPLSEVSAVEHWILDGAGTSNAVSVQLFWENAFRSGIDNFSTDLQVAAFNGNTWETAGNGGVSGSLNAGAVVSAQPVSGFTTFTLGSLSPAVNPLATQLLSFTADQPTPGTVALEWTLPSEDNTFGYAVERSTPGTAWQQIGFVASRGVTPQPLAYTYQDRSTQGLTQAAYRLRQTNAAGVARYSAVASVAITSSPLATTSLSTIQFSVFPNPASQRVTVRLSAAANGPARVLLTDLSGRTVLTQKLRGNTDAEINLPASLSTGVYLLRVAATGYSSKPQRLVVQ
ncbi:right-handed parallel beta-helix repeat-containing protein [Hymenobacter sp. BT186]|uniref:Right-handed parallel beta-helix repeat-containing protein n=1 Tax=Hymenobacter telluris TaxID=2816474 RepID=A0A939JFI4_9BACT|nr:T9SS type A sorting domain-containing protein [Hymenobacter telluris]MBO0361048.1 right-handed parallel beta-helix repeat-containing protein [Hymenobacter telluris]MBW3377076.1 right-handed parallel beta-helix repeat-containing protein [Hymenobacter norwichensis]